MNLKLGKTMNDTSSLQLCTDFLKAYFGNPTILTLLLVLVLGVGANMRLKKIEKTISLLSKTDRPE